MNQKMNYGIIELRILSFVFTIRISMRKIFKFLLGLVLLVIIGAIVCCIVGFFCPRFTYLNADNIVITFLGVLATFVVISNFSQVADIRDRTEKELDRMQKQMDLKELEQEKKIYMPSEKAEDLMSKNEEVRNLVVDLGLDIK